MIYSFEINILEKFDIEKNPDGFVPASQFRKFINYDLASCDYTTEERKTLPEFIYYFCLDIPDKANILQYYYFINNDENYYSAYIWGIPNNGRLGVSEDVINANEQFLKKSEINKVKSEFNNDPSRIDSNKNYEESEDDNDGVNIGKTKIRRIKPVKVDFKVQHNVNIVKIACGNFFLFA